MIIVQLFHGRNHPDDEPHDWGFEGPVLGPYEWFHMTYGDTIHLGEDMAIKLPALPNEIDFPPFDNNGLVNIFGSLYGDMSIISLDSSNEYLKEKLTKTKEILSTPLEKIPSLVNDPDEWVRNFAQYVLSQTSNSKKESV